MNESETPVESTDGLARFPLTPRRCKGTAKTTGGQCGRPPIVGGDVCIHHGGGAPQVIAAAKMRLLEAVEPAISRLLRFIETPPGLCEVCGRCDDTSAIVSAIRTVLDRAGLGPSSTLAVVTPDNPYDDMTEDQLIARLEKLLDTMYAQRDFRDTIDGHTTEVSVEPIHDASVPFPSGTPLLTPSSTENA